MSWWKTALYDTCSIITLDKLILLRAGVTRQFPTSIRALDESFTKDQMRAETAKRMKPRVKICPLPSPAALANALLQPGLPKSLAEVDRLVYGTAMHHTLAVVTADKRLAKALQAAGIRVGNIAVVLQELVIASTLNEVACERILVGLAAHNDLLLGTPTPTWDQLKKYSFP